MAAFTVRVFGHRGIQELPVVLQQRFASDAVYQLVQPYEWRDDLAVNGATPVSSAPTAAPDETMVLRVEVPDGEIIRYEINPPGRDVDADANSPQMSGINQIYFRQGWTISMRDATGT